MANGSRLPSQNSLIRTAIIPVIANDQVVEDLDVEIAGGVPDLPGQFFIRLAGFQAAGRVVVTEDHADGVLLQGFFEDDPGVGYGAGNAALTNNLEMVDLIGPVQEKHGKNLVLIVPEQGLKVTGHV